MFEIAHLTLWISTTTGFLSHGHIFRTLGPALINACEHEMYQYIKEHSTGTKGGTIVTLNGLRSRGTIMDWLDGNRNVPLRVKKYNITGRWFGDWIVEHEDVVIGYFAAMSELNPSEM